MEESARAGFGAQPAPLAQSTCLGLLLIYRGASLDVSCEEQVRSFQKVLSTALGAQGMPQTEKKGLKLPLQGVMSGPVGQHSVDWGVRGPSEPWCQLSG